jgi:hypothetical protein
MFIFRSLLKLFRLKHKINEKTQAQFIKHSYREEPVIEQQLEKDLLRKLLHHRIIGERHTSIINLPKSFPKHLRGEIKKAIGNLIKKGFLLIKPTGYGLEASINPKRLGEIKEMIFE